MKQLTHYFKRAAIALTTAFGVGTAFAAEPVSAAKQAAAAHMNHGGGSSMMLVMLLLVLAFYVLLIRPQTKRAKEHRQLVDNISVGDEVVTTAGLVGSVVRLADAYVVLSVAGDTELTFQKSALAMVLPKGTIGSIQ